MANDLKPLPPTDARVRAIAKDVGNDLVAYIEAMYPEMVQACRSWKSAKVSLRNHVYNQIMAAVQSADEGRDEQQIKSNERHRRVIKKLRSARSVDDVIVATRGRN